MIDIIVPVYNGMEELRRCLKSVLANPQSVNFQLVIIDDASPDPEIVPYLRKFAATHERVKLLENSCNQGFVATVNRGMSLHPERDVVLLNSDTEVANNWLDRMCATAYSNDNIGTVTPFSNNATICSFPVFCKDNPLPEGWDLCWIDEVFTNANPGELVDIPTAVGFCMYIRRQCLLDIGLFDAERFGRGYGEENDFCRRAANRGWRNVLCCDVFVFHEGGVSFSDEKAELVNVAERMIERLHPGYHQLIQRHVQEDPASVYRMWTQLEMLRHSPRHRVLHLTHHLGGGVTKHIRELADYLDKRMDALVIRPVEGGGIRLYFGAENNAPSLFFQLPLMYSDLLRLLRHVGVSMLHFHHTLELPSLLVGLPKDLNLPYDVSLHDYYLINAHPSQTDGNGYYTPDLEAQVSSYVLPGSIEEWQMNQRAFLESATRVIAPSNAVATEFRRHYPGVHYIVVFHPDSERQMPWPAVRGKAFGEDTLRIYVLGALSPEKGADLLESVAVAASKAKLPLEFNLLGYAYRPLDDAVIQHGAYHEEELPDLLDTHQPHLVWFTSLCPETYSYTLSETLSAGIPVAAPDIGAFPERVYGRPLTWVFPWDQDASHWLKCFVELREKLIRAGSNRIEWSNQPKPNGTEYFYYQDYLIGKPGINLSSVDRGWLEHFLKQSQFFERDGKRVADFRERLLHKLLWLRQCYAGRFIARFVPVNVQRKIKRKLSRKPLHDLRR